MSSATTTSEQSSSVSPSCSIPPCYEAVASQLPLVDYRPVERLKLPARFDHNRGHVGSGEVVEMTPAHNDGEINESIF